MRCFVVLFQTVALPSPSQGSFPSPHIPYPTGRAQSERWGASSHPRKHWEGTGVTRTKPNGGAKGSGTHLLGQDSPHHGRVRGEHPGQRVSSTGHRKQPPAPAATWGASALVIICSRAAPFFGNCFILHGI